MSRNSKRAKSRKNKKKTASGGYGWLVFQFLIIILFCAAAYTIWLDHRIRTEFEGKKWSLPARVYASPLELYAGLLIDQSSVEKQLQALGYHHVHDPRQAGEYIKEGPRLKFISRDFEFWDGKETSRIISLLFSQNRLDAVDDFSTGDPVSILRLEPELIGKIYPEHHEDRILIAYDEVPPLLIDSLIAIEDKNYFRHFGIDLKGIARAAWTNLRTGDVKQGGSTLTQQLVKNFFLTHERTYWRKFNEMIMSILLERHYSKQEILAAYLNEIYLGQQGALGVHGFGTAAEFYFARPLNELRVDQLALLVGLVKGASYYNPRRHPARAKERRNLVIKLMQEQGYLDKTSADKAIAAPLDIVASPGWSGAKYPAYLELVSRQLQVYYKPEDLRSEGLRIFTTLNPQYQEIAGQAVKQRLTNLEKNRNLPENSLQAAVIVSSVETGEILALIGGREKNVGGFNRALDAKRPIGSLIKPAIYLTALSQPEKYNVLTELLDAPIILNQPDGSTWMPKNYDGEAHGDLPLHVALERSYNLATVRLGMELGMDQIRPTFRQLGIEGHVPDYPSVYLGALELTPLQVTQMYQTLASNGFQIPLRAIREVLDKDGNPLQRYPLDIKQTLDSKAVHITNYLLTEVVNNGTARSLSNRLPHLMPLAGKTGTTNDLKDSWFAGFGDNILAVVWLGRDDNIPAGLTGASGALQVWTDMMQEIKPQPLSLIPPEGVTWVPVLDDGRLINDCPGSRTYPFIEPYLPPAISCPLTRQYPYNESAGPATIPRIIPRTVPESRTTEPQPETKPVKPKKKEWSIFDIFR
jgi:penicillin-binding protein 1B